MAHLNHLSSGESHAHVAERLSLSSRGGRGDAPRDLATGVERLLKLSVA